MAIKDTVSIKGTFCICAYKCGQKIDGKTDSPQHLFPYCI